MNPGGVKTPKEKKRLVDAVSKTFLEVKDPIIHNGKKERKTIVNIKK